MVKKDIALKLIFNALIHENVSFKSISYEKGLVVYCIVLWKDVNDYSERTGLAENSNPNIQDVP
jgi:hypothetical protein